MASETVKRVLRRLSWWLVPGPKCARCGHPVALHSLPGGCLVGWQDEPNPDADANGDGCRCWQRGTADA